MSPEDYNNLGVLTEEVAVECMAQLTWFVELLNPVDENGNALSPFITPELARQLLDFPGCNCEALLNGHRDGCPEKKN